MRISILTEFVSRGHVLRFVYKLEISTSRVYIVTGPKERKQNPVFWIFPIAWLNFMSGTRQLSMFRHFISNLTKTQCLSTYTLQEKNVNYTRVS